VRALVGFLGLLAGLVVAVVLLFTRGEVLAVVGLLVTIAAAFAFAAVLPRGVAVALVAVELAVIVLGGAWIARQTVSVIDALTTTEGPAEPADPALFEIASQKFDDIEDSAGFRLELMEEELEAFVQDGLSGEDVPLSKVTIDVIDGEDGEQGHLEFVGAFKSGDLEVEGSLTARLEVGAVLIELLDIDLGSLRLPGLAEGAVEDLIESITDLNETLAAQQADVQSIEIGNDRIVITGTQGGGELLTSTTLLSGLREQAATVSAAVQPPPERIGPGTVDGLRADGPTYYVALGDSLAANIGVEAPRDGYVSRFHKAIEERDGASYGLRNFGISGETSGTLIRGGQLEDAVAFLEGHEVTYVTIDIGANDLLGHLGSAECSVDLDDPRCRSRIDTTFRVYGENMERIFDELRDAAPEATIVFMRAYNPFSLGFGASIGLEETSNEILDSFNDLAARIAAEQEVLVADAFTPMQDTAAATTHMLDDPPDIHPVAIGFDVLAAALLDALGG
jgi:lysophospholipase L1-like esterase